MSMPLAHNDEWVPEIGIGERLRVVRRGKHRTQDEMAALLGVKKDAYGAWESGRNAPSLQEAQKLARQLYLLDRVPQWWTLGADQPPANVWGGARSSTDRASDYGSEVGVFKRPASPRHGRRRTDRPRHLSIVAMAS